MQNQLKGEKERESVRTVERYAYQSVLIWVELHERVFITVLSQVHISYIYPFVCVVYCRIVLKVRVDLQLGKKRME